MARYYHKMGSTITEEFDSHHAADRRRTERLIHDFNLLPEDIAILLDVDSIGRESQDEMKALLLSDPALSAIFKLGRNVGYQDAERVWRDRTGLPA
jgi:hypothetical protein